VAMTLVLEVARGMGFVPNLPAVNGSTFPDVRIKSRKSAVHAGLERDHLLSGEIQNGCQDRDSSDPADQLLAA
jgi:hypothetical protein